MIIRISPEVLAQELDGETVLLDLASESYFGLDAVSTRVWQMLHQDLEVEQILDTLLAEYDVEREELAADLAGLLDQLESAGLIRRD